MRQYLVGRSSKCNIVLTDGTISANHASILIQPDGSVWLQDLGSMNGTFVNNNRLVAPIRIYPGDKVKLGNYYWNWESILSTPASPNQAPIYQSSLPPSRGANIEVTSSNSPNKWLFVLGGIALIAAVTFLGIKMGSSSDEKEKTTKNEDKKGEQKSPQQKTATEIEYSTSCLTDSSIAGTGIKIGREIENTMVNMANVKVTIEDEEKVGDEVYKDIDKEEEIITSGDDYNRIYNLLKKILAKIPNPKFDYKIYLVKSDMINAFTAGGRIYVYQGIIDFTKSEDELISVIGHEVYHNELGHIANAIKKEKATESILGEGTGWIANAASAILTPSFNQEQEAMSDFHGVDVTIACGYDGCQTINLWARMSENEEEEQNELNKLARTHPFSNERKECVRNHIQRNYNYICK